MPTNAQLMDSLVEEIPALVVAATKETLVRLQRGTHKGIGSASAAKIDKGELRAGGDVAVNADSPWKPAEDTFTRPKGDHEIRAGLRSLKIGDKGVATSRVEHAEYQSDFFRPVAVEAAASMATWRQPRRNA